MIRVAVPDVEDAKALVQELARVFEPTAVSLEADQGEVRLEERHDSSQTIAQILGTIQDWLDRAKIESATVWLDETEYILTQRPLQAVSKR